MEYRVSTIGLTDELFSGIQAVLISNNVCLTPALTVRDAGYILEQQVIHLLIVDLEYLRSVGQTDWLTGIRRITLIPVIILSDNPEQDTRPMVELGADICVYGKGSYLMNADLAFAQLRRFTKYNPYHIYDKAKNASFQIGNIFIDPARRILRVRGQSVSLRPETAMSVGMLIIREPPSILVIVDVSLLIFTASSACVILFSTR